MRKHPNIAILGATLLFFNALGIPAQAKSDSSTDAALQSAVKESQQPEFKKYLSSLIEKNNSSQSKMDAEAKKDLAEETTSALRVTQDLSAAKNPPTSNFLTYYVVPAMSNLKRTQYKYPDDGSLAGPIRIIAAQGEFEAASFVLYPFVGADKVELKVSDLKGPNGTIPASAVDMKVIKIWYQAGTAWYSYYADKTGRKLVPELLLNDETLIKVDPSTRDNYLRVDYPQPRGSEYVWISSPADYDITFNDNVEPVGDAKTLQPIELTPGEFKQIWLTFEGPKKKEGTFTGTISISVDGKIWGIIPLQVRVLPFELPDPKTNYDPTRTFYASIYNHSYLTGDQTKKNGGGQDTMYTGGLELAKKRLFNQYTNMRDHSVFYPPIKFLYLGYEDVFRENLEIYKKAGLRTDVLFSAVSANDYQHSGSPEVRGKPLAQQPEPIDLINQVDVANKIVQSVLAPSTIYAFGADEPAMSRLVAERKSWKYVHDKGVKVINTGNDHHLEYGGYNEDIVNYGGSLPKDAPKKWHAFGGLVTSYANPHTGPENPDFSRRSHGLEPYQGDLDGTVNFILNWYPWSDFVNKHENIRGLNMVYPGRDGPIDTIQWEGFREGIDDIRYATLLKQLAHAAIATGKTDKIYEGRKALQWLALLDASTCDLNAARLEMISYILKLRNLT